MTSTLERTAEITAGVAFELFLFAASVLILYRLLSKFVPLPQRQVVPCLRVGVLLRDGIAEKVLQPGSYWVLPKRTLVLCDTRRRPFQIAGQDTVTVDRLNIRISLSGEYRVIDPLAFVTESTDAPSALYLEVRLATSAAVAELSGEHFLNEPFAITQRVKELLAPRAAQLGMEISQLDLWEAVPVGWLRPV